MSDCLTFPFGKIKKALALVDFGITWKDKTKDWHVGIRVIYSVSTGM